MMKKRQIVMLPSEKAVNEKTQLSLRNNKLYGYLSAYKLGFLSNLTHKKPNEASFYTEQHLYILSDEEIKESDWCIDIINNQLLQFKNLTAIILANKQKENYGKKSYFKIIATTNPELHHKYDEPLINGNLSYKGYLIPQISQDFIEAYIKEYNASNVIKEVMVEYLELGTLESSMLKLRPNNTIIINRIKERKYTRDEVLDILNKHNDENYYLKVSVKEWFNKTYPE